MSTYDSEHALGMARSGGYGIPETRIQNLLLAAILEELIMARRDREKRLSVNVTGSAAPVIPDWMGGKKKADTSGSHNHNAHLYGDDNGLKDEN